MTEGVQVTDSQLGSPTGPCGAACSRCPDVSQATPSVEQRAIDVVRCLNPDASQAIFDRTFDILRANDSVRFWRATNVRAPPVPIINLRRILDRWRC